MLALTVLYFSVRALFFSCVMTNEYTLHVQGSSKHGQMISVLTKEDPLQKIFFLRIEPMDLRASLRKLCTVFSNGHLLG